MENVGDYKMITIAVIGLGNRGSGYMRWTKLLNGRKAKITALCDCDEYRLNTYGDKYKVDKENRYINEEDFFKAGRLADAIYICTMDNDHYRQAIAAIECGYHIMLEKPVSTNISECEEIRDKAKQKGLYVVVCHVMRYSPFFKKMNQLVKSGRYGKIISVEHTENIGYFHFAHSYVRGNWRDSEKTTPMLMAKCCHDFDLIHWLMGDGCRSISSYGSLSYFKKDNSPEESGKVCLECPKHVRSKCPYDAEELYITAPIWRFTFLKFLGNVITGKPKYNREDKYDSLRNGLFGRCVYKCDNNACDHQVVTMDYGDNRYVNLNVTAFSRLNYRRTSIHMEKADILCDESKGRFTINMFGKGKKTVYAGVIHFVHISGDIAIVKNFIKLLSGKPMKTDDLTFIDTTIVSHRNVMLAEQSRKEGGRLIYL
jgi:predicted dehydrogenase